MEKIRPVWCTTRAWIAHNDARSSQKIHCSVPTVDDNETMTSLPSFPQSTDQGSVASSAFTRQPENNGEANATLLSFPKSHFNEKTGMPPKNEEDARRLWQWRKNRPPPGTDTGPIPENAGKTMLKEAKELHKSLRDFTIKAFMEDARKMADKWNLRIPGTNECPVLLKDFLKAHGAAMKRNDDNERKVHMTCHHFHRHRNWLADVVDRWCATEAKIHIVGFGKVPGKEHREHPTDRGGFTVVAREAKAQAVKSLMRPMLKNAGWNIATTNGQGRGAAKQTKKYEKVKIAIELTGNRHDCYVVTNKLNSVQEGEATKVPVAASMPRESSTSGSTVDDPIEIDSVIDIGNFVSELGDCHWCRSFGGDSPTCL